MAHVKVARRSMDKKQWIAIRVKWLHDQMVKTQLPVQGWRIQEARQIEEMSYEMIGEEHPIQDGDMYFTPDGTVFLSNTIQLPDDLINEDVWFHYETAAEMMVKVNGQWVGGVDPNRQRIQIKKAEDQSLSYDLWMEGYNRSKPDDERNLETAHLRGCRQVFGGGKLLVIDPLVQEAYYDAKLLMETVQCEYIEEAILNKIEMALHEALLNIPFENVYGDTDIKAMHKGIKAFKAHLEGTVYNEATAYHIGKVALVAHSHLDIAYYWRRIHTVQKNARTCLIQLDLMDKYQDFKYAHTQAYTFESLEKNYPDIFRRVKEKVKSGQFELAGGMYVEPDCNIPTAEATIRQCFYGQKYFRETFDQTVTNCWLPDVFGNSWVLPQILKKCGMDYFVSNKMSTWNDTNRFPHNNFIWKGIDGTDIFACVPPTHFISWNTPAQLIENWETFQDRDRCDETLNMFGYGDGGSGATEEMIEYMHRLNRIPSIPESRHIRGDEFLRESIREDQNLATWDGELYLEMHRGTFTTKGYLKKTNRQLELALKELEYLWSLAYLETGQYPEAAIDDLWKLLLINQFHDILPGTHIAPVEVDVRKDYSHMLKTIDALREEAGSLLWGEGNKDAYYNPLGYARKGMTFLEGGFEGQMTGTGQLGSSAGKQGLWVDLTSLSPYGKLELDACCQHDNDAWFTWDGRKLITPLYEVVFAADGRMTSLVDRSKGRELVEEGKSLNDLHIYHDYPGMYDAWDILASYKDLEDPVSCSSDIQLIEEGPLYIAFKVQLATEASKWQQEIRFYRNDPAIDIDYHVEWHEKQRLAKVEFNLAILAREVGCDTSAGTVYRETHRNTTWQQSRFEVCMHKYVDIYEPGQGFAIINDCKYGVSAEKNQIGISLLRGTIRPDNNSDMGEHRFSLRLLPHDQALAEAGIIEEAWKFNVPLAKVGSGMEAGLVDSDGQLHIQSIKKRHGGEDKKLVIRLTELHGRRGHATIKLDKALESVKTLNMLEDYMAYKQGDLLDPNSVAIPYKPFEIITLEVTFR